MSVLPLYLCYFILNIIIIIIIIIIGPSLSHQTHHASSCLPQNHKALFVFGDSLFDNGNNNYINTTTFLQSNFPPYGETFFKYPSGRFSDGRVISDFIAGYAKLSLIPPYLHPRFTHEQYIYGVNFASAGAGALVETNKGAVVDLKTQSFYFGKVSKQLRQELGEEEAKKLLSKAVYIFSIGGNDYAAPFYNGNSSTAAIPYPQQQFVDFVIGNISSVIKDIYNEGGRKFGFLNVYPLGCIPLLRIMVAGNSIEDCLQHEVTVLARLQNNDLPKTLQKLQKELIGFKYSVTDNYAAFLDLIQNPSKYGLKVGSKACCGGGRFGGDYSCGGKRGIETYNLCSNPNDYVFFDAAHPTDNTAHYISHIMWMGNHTTTYPKHSHYYNLKQLFEL